MGTSLVLFPWVPKYILWLVLYFVIYIIYRLVFTTPTTWSFIVLCIVLKIADGAGNAMFVSASYSLLPRLFPKHVGTVTVSKLESDCFCCYCLLLFSLFVCLFVVASVWNSYRSRVRIGCTIRRSTISCKLSYNLALKLSNLDNLYRHACHREEP